MSRTRSQDDLAVGVAAEHLVCFDLLMSGYRAFRTDQVCPYDVVVYASGRLWRIQVKGTSCPRAIPQRIGHYPAYMWHVRRAGKGGRRVYAKDEFDLLALVAVDSKQIAYLPPSKVKQTVHIRTHGHSGPRGVNGKGPSGKVFGDYTFEKAIGVKTNV